ncbi:MAG: alanine racemase [Cycloclasticus sp.]|nr:alanine racemase [Cycloclasticus sp.]
MKPDYLPPAISNELGRTSAEATSDRNHYAHGFHTQVLTDIDGIKVSDLVERFGSPLFVFSEQQIRNKAKQLRNTFKSRYPDTLFAWSYKTNYLNAICQTLHQEGWIAEVVSDFEYRKSRKLGIAGKDIVFNGPGKSREILKQAISEGALIQVDHWDEICLIEELVKNRKQPLNIGIRVWLDTGIGTTWSKFGFSLDNGEAARVATRIINNPNLRLHTLHTHIGTYILDPNAYRIATQKLLALREQLEIEHNHLVDCLNLGGGFPSHSLLHGMMGPAEQVIPPIEDYADAITGTLNKLPDNKKPQLRFETGRFLIDEAGYLLTSTIAVKGNRHPAAISPDLSAHDYKERLLSNEDTKASYVIDAGINLLYTAAWYQINVLPSRKVNAALVPSRLYGPLCMAIDIVRYHVDLPPLKAGDILTLHPVGAYNFTQSMQFITFRPAVALINEDGSVELIRHAEKLEDIDGPELMPAHLIK